MCVNILEQNKVETKEKQSTFSFDLFIRVALLYPLYRRGHNVRLQILQRTGAF